MRRVHDRPRCVRQALRTMNLSIALPTVVVVAVVALVGRGLYAQCTNYPNNACSWVVGAGPCADTTTCFTVPNTFLVYCTGNEFQCNRYMNTNPPSVWANCAQNVGGAIYACNQSPQPCGTTQYYQYSACTPHNLCASPLNGNQPDGDGGYAAMGNLTWCESPTTSGNGLCP